MRVSVVQKKKKKSWSKVISFDSCTLSLQGWKVWHGAHPHQPGSCVHLYWTGRNVWIQNVIFPFVPSISDSFSYLLIQGTVLCDIILLNFLKGAEQYKAKKFEEVVFRLWFIYSFFHVAVNGSLFTHFFFSLKTSGLGGSDRSVYCSESSQPDVARAWYQVLLRLRGHLPRRLWAQRLRLRTALRHGGRPSFPPSALPLRRYPPLSF